MSRSGLATVRGSQITVKRATDGQALDGSATKSWANVATGVAGLLEELTAERAQEIWGQETRARWRTSVPWGTDVLIGDGVLVTSGNFTGRAFRVEEQLERGTSPGTRHIELGLEETTETFA